MAEAERVFDELLVILAHSGDARAAERLAQRWAPRLMRTARRVLRDQSLAEEATQEAWAGICRGWGRLRDPARFPAWAFGILARKCADVQAREIRGRQSSAQLQQNTEPSVSGQAEDRHALNQAFAKLDDIHRLTATLFFGEQLSLAEIAQATNVPLGTVKSRLFHARKHLKSLLKGDQHD